MNMDMERPWYARRAVLYSAVVIAGIFLMSYVSRWSQQNNVYTKPFIRQVKTLVDRARAYGASAQQDKHPLIQYRHCLKALHYAEIVKELASEGDIEAVTDIDIQELLFYLRECLEYNETNIGQLCPALKVNNAF